MNNTTMFILKCYIRNLIRNKVFSAVTIGSFALSMAVVVILASFLAAEYGYDRHIPDIGRIYRVAGPGNDAFIPEEARELLIEDLPGIESATKYMISNDPVIHNETTYNARVINSDEGIFSVLPIKFLSGSPEGLFDDKYNAVITASLAERIFGEDDPMGRIINLSHREDVIVAGVIQDFPDRSTLKGEIIISTDLKLWVSRSCYNDNCMDFYKLLLKLDMHTDRKEIAGRLSSIIPDIRKIRAEQSDSLIPEEEYEERVFTLLPYKSAYFDTSLPHDGLQHANVKLIKLLVWLTVILLALSVFNYVNLTLAQSLSRLKEFGMKKILGLDKVFLFRQFGTEAMVTLLISFAIALYLAILVKPVFENMFGKTIHISYLFSSPGMVLLSLAGIMVTAVFSALYPAYLAIHVQARDLIGKRISCKKGGEKFRKTLNVVQFAASIAILVSLFVISRQIHYVRNKDFGFSTEQLVRIPVHWQAGEKIAVLIDAMSSIPGVVSACHSHGTPGGIWNYSANQDIGRVSVISSDYRFLPTFGIPVAEGRNFFAGESREVCLINRKAMIQAEWEDFEGKSMFGFEVVGLVEDFHFQDLYHEIGALMIANDIGISHITARIVPRDMPATIDQVKKAFLEILPGYEFSFQFYDDYLGGMYEQEERRATSLRIIALIAIFISCIGLFGLVDYSTKSRTKEIGIRKVNGAMVWEVMAMLNMDFVKWVAVAFVIATPAAWYAMNRWLQNFAYRTDLSWWIFAMAGLLTMCIAMLTVSWQSWRAARRNPVEALRYE
jgi:putative ABC transport system permease protein